MIQDDPIEFQKLLGKAPNWLEEFNQNKDNPQFLKERINLPCWIHLSPSRLSNLLDQIDRTKQGTNSASAHKVWPQFVNKYRGTDQADSIYAIIEYGLRNREATNQVLKLIVHLISIPSVRLKLEPLIHDTLFMVRLPEGEDNLVNLLEYYLSFQCTIDKGALSWDQVRKNYNNLILKFQNCIFSNLPPEQQCDTENVNPLVAASQKQLNDIDFLQRHLSELPPEIFDKLTAEFGICPRNVSYEESTNLAIAGLARMLVSPVNPLDDIPRFLIPTRRPPPDLVYPHFGRHALCLNDAVLQVFQAKRVSVSNEVLNFIEKVNRELELTRYCKHCCPLLAPIAISMSSGVSSDKTCFSIILDPQFLNYDFTPPVVGDILYLLVSETGVICPFVVVSCVSNNSFIGHLECDALPSDKFDIAIKLPAELRYEVQRLLQLPKILSSKGINESVVDAFTGMANKDRSVKPPITVMKGSFCSWPECDAATWLANQHRIDPTKKTIVFGTNSKQLDKFVSSFCDQVGRFPAMNILRLDFKTQVSNEIVLNSRQALLEYVAKIDKSFSYSCATAINSLILYRESLKEKDDKEKDSIDELNTLLKQLEFVRPLEYIADPEKRLDYLKKTSPIICHLIGEPLKIKENETIHLDNCIILDSCNVDDSDILWIMNKINPSCIRLHGEGEAAKRLSLMLDDVVSKEIVQHSMRKTPEILEFLGLRQVGEAKLAPGVITTCNVWFEKDLLKAFEIAVASAIFFYLLEYKSIIVVADNEKFVHQLFLMFLKRSSWNRVLMEKLKDSFFSTNYVIKKNLTADVVIYVETSELNNTRVGEMANAASFVFWSVCVPSMNEEGFNQNVIYDDEFLSLFDNSLFIRKLDELYNRFIKENRNSVVTLALNENFNDLNNLSDKIEREPYNIVDPNHLLALVYSMQVQLHQSLK